MRDHRFPLLRAVRLAAIVALAIAAGARDVRGTTRFGGGNPVGPEAVGFRVLETVDTRRPPVAGREGRPLQIAVWYPAVPGGGAPIHYRDYVGLVGAELSGREDEVTRAGAIDDFRARLIEGGVAADAFDAWMAAPRPARRDAPPLPGRHPLVLVAQGNFHSVHHQSVLCERLASYGFVVATTPSQTRISGPITDESQVLASAHEQEADLFFARDRMRAGGDVAPGPYALVGHSFGARSALLLALDDPDARALVSLDGGIANRNGEGWYRGDRAFDPTRLRAPVLHLHQPGDAVVVPDFRLLESLLGSDRYTVEIPGLVHGNFNVYGWASAAFASFSPRPTPPDLGAKLELVESLAIAFLRAEGLEETGDWDAAARTGMASSEGPRWRHLPPGRP